MAPGRPEAVRLVPSIGSTATSHSGSSPFPISSPKYSIGASSFSPSPITTVPFMSTDASALRIASTARPSAASLLQRRCGQGSSLCDAQQLKREVAIDLRLFDHRLASVYEAAAVAGGLTQAAAADRELVRFDPEVKLSGQPAGAGAVDVDAGPLEHGRDADSDALKHGVEAVDQNLILIELNLAEAPRSAPPPLGRELEPDPGSCGHTWLDRQP